ncbi:MAG: diguanylate cyclase [Thermoleophilia bacterium]|nr:diguanylate cyclase [Thermoleophilia bacterium]
MTTPGRARRTLRRCACGLRPVQIATILLLVVCGVALLAALLVVQRDARRDERQVWAQRAAASINDEVAGAGSALIGARGLFAASRDVEPSEFETFAAVQLQGSDLLSLIWAERVTAARRAAFERDLGVPILETPPGGVPGPAGARPQYFPLTLIAPAGAPIQVLRGVDAASAALLRPSLTAARDGGGPVMTSALNLDADGGPTAVGLLVAVYGAGPAPATRAERRATLRGYVGGIFAVDRLAQSAHALLPHGARLRILSSGSPVLDTGEERAAGATSDAAVGDTGWTVQVSLVEDPVGTVLPAIGVGAGLLTLILLLAGLFAQANQRRREREDARAQLQHEADTDGLTGLANRRRLERDLARALPGASEEQPLALILFDLNGFKAYNDRFGHPAGDALLVRLAAGLSSVVPQGRAYRLGGDEFCVVAPLGADAAMAVVASALEALSERGDGFTISAAHGVALIPADAATADEAMLVADRRMYARKALGRDSATNQIADVLVRTLEERSPDLRDHTDGVARLADRVAQRLGIGDTGRGPIRHAALLHDVGKVAIPDSILQKPSALDAAERAFIERHTIIGERILRAAPSLASIAPLVRSSHERWDGTGYPDGLAGEEIPLGARIVFACDAFDAMTSSLRTYREAFSQSAALDEIAACAGTQFDPQVAAALIATVREGEPAAAGARDPAPAILAPPR